MKIAVFTLIIVSVFVFSLQKNKWYSQSDIAKHSTETSCWTSINGNVYDVTKLANTHSGGSKGILQTCGKDGSAIFDKRHGDEGDVQSELENYRIGTIH